MSAVLFAHHVVFLAPDSLERLDTIEDILSRVKDKLITPDEQAAHEARKTASRNASRIADLKTSWNAPARHLKVKAVTSGQWGKVLSSLLGRLGTGFLTVLHGTNGNGKTQLGVELMRRQVEVLLKSARFTSSTEFFMAVKATYRDGATKDEAALVDEYCKPSLLVMDELEKRGETEWENNLLFHLFNRRYNAERDTLLISNLPQAELDQHLGPSLVSRLNETGGMIHCDWPSRR